MVSVQTLAGAPALILAPNLTLVQALILTLALAPIQARILTLAVNLNLTWILKHILARA